MNTDSSLHSALRAALISLLTLAAMAVLFLWTDKDAGGIWIGVVALLSLLTSSVAIVRGSPDRWFHGALAVALLCGAMGPLHRGLLSIASASDETASSAIDPAQTDDPAVRTDAPKGMPVPSAIPTPTEAPSPQQAEALEDAARQAGMENRPQDAVRLFEEAIAQRMALGDVQRAAFAGVNLAITRMQMGNAAEASAALAQALPGLESLPLDHPARATALSLAAEWEMD